MIPGVASDYDDELWRLVPDEPGRPPAHIVDFVRALPAAARALDLGCGDGRLACELGAGEISLADPSAVALERARRRMPGAREAQLEPDGPLPFTDGEFDLVLCAETLEHVRDTQRFLSEVRRVLAPRGTLAVTTPAHGRLTGLDVMARGFSRRFDPMSPHLRFYSRSSLEELLGEMGFEVVSVRRRRGSLLALATR